MELSALIAEFKVKNFPIEQKTNLKKYYNTYPSVVRLLFKRRTNSSGYSEISRSHRQEVDQAVRKNLSVYRYQIRHEWYWLTVFCHDPSEVLEAIAPVIKKSQIDEIIVETMPETVFEESSIKPELPRAQTTVVKRLPHKKYRYRAYWPMTKRVMASIGRDALESIIYQINADPKCKPIKDGTAKEILRMGYQYGGRYFYTEDENIFCIISLINPKFIEKIEKFVTLEELNAKTASRSTDQ